MELLDLAPELFQRIVRLLVEDVGTVKATQYQLVCSECPGDKDDKTIADNVRNLRRRDPGRYHCAPESR
jgi:hypothetical protein